MSLVHRAPDQQKVNTSFILSYVVLTGLSRGNVGVSQWKNIMAHSKGFGYATSSWVRLRHSALNFIKEETARHYV